MEFYLIILRMDRHALKGDQIHSTPLYDFLKIGMYGAHTSMFAPNTSVKVHFLVRQTNKYTLKSF